MSGQGTGEGLVNDAMLATGTWDVMAGVEPCEADPNELNEDAVPEVGGLISLFFSPIGGVASPASNDDGETYAYLPAGAHAGGVKVHNGWVYVQHDNKEILRYSVEHVRKALPVRSPARCATSATAGTPPR